MGIRRLYMKAWLVRELGDPEDILKLEEIEIPVPKEQQVLIRVEAASLNFFDILLCQGKYQEKPPLPFTFGSEISGIVIKTRKDGPFKEGQRVLALPKIPNGGL